MRKDDDTTSGATREHRDEEFDRNVGVGTDGSLHSEHHHSAGEHRDGPGVGTDGSLENHVENDIENDIEDRVEQDSRDRE